jgi:hypothetical protein
MADDYDDYKVGPAGRRLHHPFPQGAVRQSRRPQRPPTAFSRTRAWSTVSDMSAPAAPGDPTRFLLARSVAPGLVPAEDIMVFDLDGAALDPGGRAL